MIDYQYTKEQEDKMVEIQSKMEKLMWEYLKNRYQNDTVKMNNKLYDFREFMCMVE